jgi:NTE family protein
MSAGRRLAVLCAFALLPTAQAQDNSGADPVAAVAARPRVALVLSGGGARGFAHIGVLRVLRELHVPVDMVVGTSMGSVVGGAYAAGASVAELDAMARRTDWDRVVADRPARDNLEFRRREEDLLLPSRIEFGVHRDGVTLPPSAAGNAALEAALGRLLPAGTRDKPVSQLALPFRSVASDLVSGELVDLVDTPLFLTMRASLAVPGVFAPVRVHQRLVVDGGLVRNLPIDLAHKMGADIVIAVNVGTPLASEHELGSALGVAQQMINILTEQNVQRSIKELRPNDILIAPTLDGVTFMDFRNVDGAIRAGEEAARKLSHLLAPLALGAADYAVFENKRLAAPPLADLPLPLANVAVQTNGQINPQILANQAGLAAGKPVTKAEVRAAAQQLYGRGDLARVETDIEDEQGKRKVTIRATEAPWANSRLRVGLELASDFDDANAFAIKLMHVYTSLNSWGGELRTVARIGDKRDLGMQFFQPLGPGSQWYAAASTQYGSSSLDVFAEGRRKLRLAYSVRANSVVLGRELGAWGDIHAGVMRQRIGARVVIPDDPAAPITHGYETNNFLSYRVDTLDSLGFPSSGNLLDVELTRATKAVDGHSAARTAVLGLSAFRTTNWAGHLYGEYAYARDGAGPLTLGGFFRLSGSTPDSVEGRSIAFARLVMARRIGALPVTLGGVVRAGFSLEMGGAFDRDNPAPAPGSLLKQAASGFLSVDTRFGPAYVGAGATKGGKGTVYLFLGPIW